MEFQRPHYCLFLVLLLSLLSYFSQAYVFYAGGRDGWVLKPSENYNHWAGRNRFQVNDTIVFKYKKGSNSVLVVNKDGYDKCNKTNPIKKFEDGDSVFKFDRSGPFYFISGTDYYCEKGQKLIVVVLAVRPQPHYPPTPSVSPSPVSPPPVAHPPSPAVSPQPSSPVPAVKPHPPSPAPAVSPHPPTLAPGISPSSPVPAIIPPAPAHAPSYPTPASAPAPAKTSPSPSPAYTPAYSPTSPPSPSTSSPGASPPSPPASTPSSTPGSSGTPSTSPPGSANPSSSNETAPPPNGSAAWSVAPSSLLVYSATIVLSAALGEILVGQ